MTLGGVDYTFSTKESLLVAGKLPKMLHFGSIACDPEIRVLAPEETPSKVLSPKTSSPEAPHEEIIEEWPAPDPAKIAEVPPRRPFPKGFLDSLRQPRSF